MSAAQIASALGGKRVGDGWIVRCVAHDDRSPSLSLRDADDGRLLVYCHAGCNSLDVLAKLRRLGLGGDESRPVREVIPCRPQIVAATDGTETIGELRERVARLLQRAQSIKGTLAERYLIGRGVDPEIIDPEALRFLPGNDMYPPAMLALISDFRDPAAILGLQLTALTADGQKIERRFLRGSKPKGGVVRLVENADVTTELGLAEGVETALAVMTGLKQAGRTVRPVWSALNAANLGSLPVLGGIERLYVYADNDKSGTGQRAAQAVGQRWYEAAREPFIVLPRSSDWNDAANGAAA